MSDEMSRLTEIERELAGLRSMKRRHLTAAGWRQTQRDIERLIEERDRLRAEGKA